MQARTVLLIKISVISLLILILSVISVVFYFQSILYTPSKAGDINFKIVPGTSVSTITNDLQDKQVIKSALAFRLYLKLYRLDSNLQAGDYFLPANLNAIKLANILQHGVSDIKLTFIEGWRTEEFAEYADKNLENVSYDDFVYKANGLEGMLFPDTYAVNSDITTDELITLLKTTFDERMGGYFEDPRIARTGLSLNEVFTMASIIEREVSTNDARKIVAGILLKRLAAGQKLEADATTQYSVGTKGNWWPHDLTVEQLASTSPYNTRAVSGLPPTPISSFGTASIESVLDYVDSPYYFYITGKDGQMYYAETLDQHIENINNHL